jgi:hypothetical protein
MEGWSGRSALPFWPAFGLKSEATSANNLPLLELLQLLERLELLNLL